MSGKSSDRQEKSGKNKTNAGGTPLSCNMSSQEDMLLTTRHEILMENYESLKQDYASLEQRFKLVEEMNEMMKLRLQNQNQSKELEPTNLRLLKDLERERDEYKKMVEEMKRKESESEATINELRISNEERLVELEKEEEEKKKMEDKHDELAKRYSEIEKELAKKLNGQGMNNVAALEDEVILVGENHNVNYNNNTVADAIVLSDESEAENDNPTRESNINNTPLTPLPRVVKQEESSNGVNSSQVRHQPSSKVKQPSSSSSSSSSSSDVYLVSLKRPRRDDYNKTF